MENGLKAELFTGSIIAFQRLKEAAERSLPYAVEEKARVDDKLDEPRAAILLQMSKSPKITVTELGRHPSLRGNATDKNIQILKRADYIQRIGPAKGGHWEVILSPSPTSKKSL